jgi:hypothetical protein
MGQCLKQTLTSCQDYQRIFLHANHPRLTEALIMTYRDIIELCMEFRTMIRAQQKNVMKRVVHALSSSYDQKLKDAESKFRTHRKNVDKEAEVCHMIEAAEARAVMIRDKHLQQLSNKGSWRLISPRSKVLIVCSGG